MVSVQVVAQQVGRKRKKFFAPHLPTADASSSSSSSSHFTSPSLSDSHHYLGFILLRGDEIELINVHEVRCRHHSNHPVLQAADQVPHVQQLPKLRLLLDNRDWCCETEPCLSDTEGEVRRGRLGLLLVFAHFPKTSISLAATHMEGKTGWRACLVCKNKNTSLNTDPMIAEENQISWVAVWMEFCEGSRLYMQEVKANVWYFRRLGASSCSDIFDEDQVQQLCLLQKTQKNKQQEVITSSCFLLRV